MKLTKETLKRIIKEELDSITSEGRLNRMVRSKKSKASSGTLSLEDALKDRRLELIKKLYAFNITDDEKNEFYVLTGDILKYDVSDGEAFFLVKKHVANDDEELAKQIVQRLIDSGEWPDDFFLGAGITPPQK
jgi:hypothetical protein